MGGGVDEEGSFQMKRVKGRGEVIYPIAVSSDRSQKSSTQIKSESVALRKLSLRQSPAPLWEEDSLN